MFFEIIIAFEYNKVYYVYHNIEYNMALVKLVTEMYESKGSNNSLATRNPARTIMDELGPYSHFVEYFQELET